MISKTGIVVIFMTFYAVIFAFVGFAYGSQNTPTQATGLQSVSPSFLDNIFTYFSNVITGFLNMPIWLSGIVLVPFVSGLVFILITSLPTVNGGS